MEYGFFPFIKIFVVILIQRPIICISFRKFVNQCVVQVDRGDESLNHRHDPAQNPACFSTFGVHFLETVHIPFVQVLSGWDNDPVQVACLCLSIVDVVVSGLIPEHVKYKWIHLSHLKLGAEVDRLAVNQFG